MPPGCKHGKSAMTVAAILTDIEGTTSSIAFVHDVLFPYAAAALPAFVAENAARPEIATILDAVRQESGEPDADNDRLTAIMLEWIAADRKITPLKQLQGHIWQHGYESGDFTGHVYADAADELHRWTASGIELYVYSSGSVGAQKLLFGHSDAGDLTSLFRGYYDTRIGHKKEASAYRKIASDIGHPAASILFLSDVSEELDAAKAAGMRTIQVVRDADVVVGNHPTAAHFDEVTRQL